VGILYSKIGHARPLGFRIIRYVRDGRTDGQTDQMDKQTERQTDGQKQRLLPLPYGREHNNLQIYRNNKYRDSPRGYILLTCFESSHQAGVKL